MSRRGSSDSLDKMSTGPSHFVRGCSDKETITLQSLLNGSEEFPPPIDVLVGFPPNTYEQGFFGMEIDDVSHRPTFVKTVGLGDVDREYGFVRRTRHPNLLNLTDFSLDEGGVYLKYERPGISLTTLKQFEMVDRIAVATIFKKVLRGLIYIHEVLGISHGNLHCDNIYINEDGEVKIVSDLVQGVCLLKPDNWDSYIKIHLVRIAMLALNL